MKKFLVIAILIFISLISCTNTENAEQVEVTEDTTMVVEETVGCATNPIDEDPPSDSITGD